MKGQPRIAVTGEAEFGCRKIQFNSFVQQHEYAHGGDEEPFFSEEQIEENFLNLKKDMTSFLQDLRLEKIEDPVAELSAHPSHAESYFRTIATCQADSRPQQ